MNQPPDQPQPAGVPPQQPQPAGVPGGPGQQPEPAAAPAAPPGGYQVKWPMPRVIIFSIISLGVFNLYWFYVTRKWITQQVQGNDRVGLQTAGQLVPILNFFIDYWLYRDISLLRQRVGLSEMPVTLYIVLLVVGAFVFSPLIIVVYVLVLVALNEYWDRSTNGQATGKPITTGEALATFIPLGVIVLGIVAIAVGTSA